MMTSVYSYCCIYFGTRKVTLGADNYGVPVKQPPPTPPMIEMKIILRWSLVSTRTAKYISVLEKWLWEQTTLGFPFSSPPPMREIESHPQMMISVYSIWYLDFGTKERSLFWLQKNPNFVDIFVPEQWLWEQTTLGIPFTSQVHPQINSVWGI